METSVEAEFLNVQEPLEKMMMLAQALADDLFIMSTKTNMSHLRYALRHKALLPAKNLVAMIENLEEKLDGVL